MANEKKNKAAAKAAETVENKAAATNAKQEENKSPEVFSAKVLRVINTKGDNKRITFVIDKEIVAIDYNTGEEILTSSITKNIFEATNQLAAIVPEIQIAQGMALGAAVNPQLIALIMAGADIKFIRVFHEKGEKRQHTDDIYNVDCYVTEFKAVKTNIAKQSAGLIQWLLTNKPAAKSEEEVMPNFMNI